MPSTDQPGNTHSTPMPDELENGPWHSFVSGNSAAFIAHAQGWLHCGIPGAAASGALKAMMQEFERVRPHPRVK